MLYGHLLDLYTFLEGGRGASSTSSSTTTFTSTTIIIIIIVAVTRRRSQNGIQDRHIIRIRLHLHWHLDDQGQFVGARAELSTPHRAHGDAQNGATSTTHSHKVTAVTYSVSASSTRQMLVMQMEVVEVRLCRRRR